MLGVLLILIVLALAWWAAMVVLSQTKFSLDPAEAFGLAGLIGLGVMGTVAFLTACVSTSLMLPAVTLAAAATLIVGRKYLKIKQPTRLPSGPLLGLAGAVVLLCFVPLINVLSPADSMEWDSLAYHFAVPKLWLYAGKAEYVPYIHQSNFPPAVDAIYMIPLQFGNESGAKLVTFFALLSGVLAIFGIGRRWYGEKSGWWAALGFASIPVVLWESGTGYIDVAHGLFAGLGILYAADAIKAENRRHIWLSAICLGLAIGSKYTGIQTLVAVGLVLLLAALLNKQDRVLSLKALPLCAVLALLIGSPGYVRNILNTGNPVYPFLYSVLGGRNWDQWRADVYADEQQSFGVGRGETGRQVSQLPAAVLGLAYQPGRYINPNQTQGGGFPMGAVGVPVLAAGLWWLISGRARRRESAVLAAVGLSLVMWFFLSQQSRYIVTIAVPLCVLLGGAVSWIHGGAALGVAVVLQAGYTGWLMKTAIIDTKLDVVFGKMSRDQYLTEREPFYVASKTINEVARGGKIALYDEVFGYFLDVPYFWANPPHSMVIPYESMQSGVELVDSLQKLGFSHVYLNLQYQDRDFLPRWVASMGLNGPAVPLSGAERTDLMRDLRTKWKILLSEAVAAKRLRPIPSFKSGLLFQVVR